MKLPVNETLQKLNLSIQSQITELNLIITEIKRPVTKNRWRIIDMT